MYPIHTPELSKEAKEGPPLDIRVREVGKANVLAGGSALWGEGVSEKWPRNTMERSQREKKNPRD